MGVQIVFAVDVHQLKEHLVLQPAGAHRRRAQQQNARARAFGDVVIAVLVLHQQLCLEARQQEADGVVVAVRGAQQARAAQLRQPVAVDDPGRGAAGAQVVVELLLELRGDIGAAHEHDLQLGKVHVGHGLEPGVQDALAGEQHVDAVVLNRLGIARVGGPAGQADDLHAHAQRRVQHVHHRVDPGHVQRQVGDHVLRGVLEVLVGLLGLDGAGHEGVHGLVGQGHRLVHAADRAGGVQHRDGVALAVGDGIALVLLQHIVHQQAARHLPELLLVDVADQLQRGNREIPAHGAGQHDDVAQAQQLLVAQQALHQLGIGEQLRDDQVGDLLTLDHAVNLLLVVQVEVIDDGHGRAGHVQAVVREDGLGQRRADQRHPRTGRAVDAHAGERLRVALPVAEHLPVGVRPVAVADGDALQAVLAVGVQIPDKGPARLIDQLTALQPLLQQRQLVPLGLRQ